MPPRTRRADRSPPPSCTEGPTAASSSYARIAARGRIDGRLKDVNRGGAPAEAYATIDHVDGLDSRQFCMARLPQVDTQTEELLKSIGRGGRIRQAGSCSAEAGALAAVRMDPVDTIERVHPEVKESA